MVAEQFGRLFERTINWVSWNCAIDIPESKKLNWWASIYRSLHTLEFKSLYERDWWEFMAALVRNFSINPDVYPVGSIVLLRVAK